MYKPNFNNKKVINKIKIALGFTGSHLSDTKPRGWSTRYIDKYFGQQQHDLSKWLRNKLLICTNNRYSKDSGTCKEYIKNSVGYNELVSLISTSTTYPSVSLEIDFVQNEYKDELLTKDFVYTDKSNRLWHPLQRVRKEYKLIVFSQNHLNYQYDIECCMPTLIYQYSQKLGMDQYLFALNEYIHNRKQIRNELSQRADISKDLAKEIINALVNGAQLGLNQDSDIYNMLHGDIARIQYLKQDPYIIELRSDIKTCWDVIKQTLSRKAITTRSGKQRMLPISSKQKAGVYFELERQVLNSIMSYLVKTNNSHFLEHDGWVCSKEIDIKSLTKWVKGSTGYNINLDRSVLYYTSTTYPSVSLVTGDINKWLR